VLNFGGTTGAKMKYPTTHDAIARMVLAQLPDGKWTLLYREHYSAAVSLHGREVPNTKDRDTIFYFCGAFALPLNTYYKFFLDTYNFSDYEALRHSDSDWSRELSMKSHEINSWQIGGAPVPGNTLLYLRNKCIKDMLNSGTTEADICALFSISDRAVKKLLNPNCFDLRGGATKQDNMDKNSNAHIVNDTRYRGVRKMIAYARARAGGKGIYGGFNILDVFPNVYSVQGNVGANNGDRFIPLVCPVLRIPLVWGVAGEGQLGEPVVWRKTNTKPFGEDNVIIMSKLASWVVEGEYAQKRIALIFSDDPVAHNAWQEWKARHPFQASKVPSHKPVRTQ
jgi:hypothetical protein